LPVAGRTVGHRRIEGFMSESYVANETAAPPGAEVIAEVIQGAPRTGARFTPLRSATVARDHTAHESTKEIRSPLVPARRSIT